MSRVGWNDRDGGASTNAERPHRWLVLWTVAVAQFMFVVNAVIVNVAIPSIRADLAANSAAIQAVIAVYLTAYGTMVVTGGRLGDIYGARRVFLLGATGFTASSLWCGLAQSGAELIFARAAQGAAAAMMVPQVLATIHVLFPGPERQRAFSVYGIMLGLGGAVGFLLGGILVTLDFASLGWRLGFLVNGPIGIAIVTAAGSLMPGNPRKTAVRLDITGAVVLFVGLLCILVPILLGRDHGWPLWSWSVLAVGLTTLAGFLPLQRWVERRGGFPLIDLGLIADRRFRHGLHATFWFHFANLSFYLVLTLYLQQGLNLSPWHVALNVTPMMLAFVAASKQGAKAAAERGMKALVLGIAVELAGVAGLILLAIRDEPPAPYLLQLALLVLGWGQGSVMAPLSGTMLARVPAAAAGSGAGLFNTITQIANAIGIAAVGAAYVALEETAPAGLAFAGSLGMLAIALVASAALLGRLAER